MTSKCDVCKKPVEDQSTDIWALVTLYEPDGEVRKTGEQGDLANDYLVICNRTYCQVWIKTYWDEFVNEVRGTQEQ